MGWRGEVEIEEDLILGRPAPEEEKSGKEKSKTQKRKTM